MRVHKGWPKAFVRDQGWDLGPGSQDPPGKEVWIDCYRGPPPPTFTFAAYTRMTFSMLKSDNPSTQNALLAIQRTSCLRPIFRLSEVQLERFGHFSKVDV